MRRVRTPVDEGERATHVGDEEVFCGRGVGADGAERVGEGYHVGGRLRARCGVEWAGAGLGGGREVNDGIRVGQGRRAPETVAT
jgi:hypothetical protein